MPESGVEAASKDGMAEVIVRHATNGLEMKVVLPASAKFKHVKTAMARRLESDEVLTRGQLINNTAGIYAAYKDNHRIGDVRQVLALCVDLEPPDGGPMEATLEEGDLTDEETDKAVASTALTTASKSSVFSRDRAIALQNDLLQGFKAQDFQSKLKALESERADMVTEAHFVKKRQALFLSVQSTVLPNYGFEGSQSGVYKMMGAMGPFINDLEFVKLAQEINSAIGLSSPQESWAALSKSCRKVEEEPRERQRNRAPARARGLPGLLGGGLGGLSGIGGGFGSFAAPAPMPALGAGAGGGGNSGTAKSPPSTAGTSPAKGASGNNGQRPGPAAAPERGAGGQRQQGGPAAPPPPAPAADAEEEPALFEPWPPEKTPPFKLFVAGSWNDYKPTQMQWQEGMFACPITLGAHGCENFQLLLNGSWDRTFYPSMPDASALEDHTVCGPDNKGHDVNWQIGKYVEEDARPHSRFVIIAGIDKSGIVRLVSWQPVGS